MKILKTYDFVSERIKVQPITNAELNKVQHTVKDVMDKAQQITKGVLPELPLKYENIKISGNVLTINNNDACTEDYIVVSTDDWFEKLPTDSSVILVIYNERARSDYDWWNDFEIDFYGRNFPTFYKSSYGHTYFSEIVKIRGTIPEQELKNLKCGADLKQIYDKYHLAYEK